MLKDLTFNIKGGTVTLRSVNIDPSTTIICDLVTKSGKTAGEAQTIFNKAFGYTPDISIAPKNAPLPVPIRPSVLRA